MPTDVVQVANPTLPSAGGAPDPKAGAAPATSAAATSKTAAGTSTSSGSAAASSSASASPAAGDAKTGDGKAADAKPGDAKPPEKPVRTAAVILAEREARLTQDRQAYKAEAERLATERKAHETDIAFARKVLDAAKGKSRLAVIDIAAEASGLTREAYLESLQDEYLGGLREPTADEKARKIVDETLAAERKKADDATKTKAAADLKTQQEQAQAAYDGYCGAVVDAVKEMGPKFAETYDLCNAHNVTPQRVADVALKLWKANGKTPTPAEALAALEEELAAPLKASKKFRAAEAPKIEDKQNETAGDKAPRTLTTTTRSVPVTSKPIVVKKLTALERLEEARRELGDAGN